MPFVAVHVVAVAIAVVVFVAVVVVVGQHRNDFYSLMSVGRLFN